MVDRINSNTRDQSPRSRSSGVAASPDTAQSIVIEQAGPRRFEVRDFETGTLLAEGQQWEIEGAEDMAVESPSQRVNAGSSQRGNDPVLFVEMIPTGRSLRFIKRGPTVHIQAVRG